MIKTNTVLELIKEQIKDNLYHGASLAIYENGEWHEHYLGTIDGNEKVKAGLVYDLASVSKVVGVGTLLAKLVYHGTIDIDKPLRYYYPTFDHQTLTVRQLATHSSGIDPFIPNRDQLNATQLKDAINHIKVLEDKSFKYT
ncbi:beta-lactamase family protein, partial [Streptococcus agalactiae]|nr:beta-lactamase family protein [Streptococcus agalactiae]